jgi:hypothetical protein
MKITFKTLSLDQQKHFIEVGEKVRIAKQEFISCTPAETEGKRTALGLVWKEFVAGTVEKIDGADVNDIQNIDMAEVLVSFFAKVLIVMT